MHSISVGYRCLKSAVRVRPVGLRSAIKGRAVLGLDGVGSLEGELRDHHYRVGTLRGRYAPIAICTQAGQLLRHLVWSSDACTHWSAASMFSVRMNGVLLTPRSTSVTST